MPGNAAGKARQDTNITSVGRHTVEFLQKKLWLPKLVYTAIPYFYGVAGLAALFATFYIAEWFWVLPHYVLFSFACLHIGIIIFRRRRMRRSSGRDESDSHGLKSVT